MADSPEITLSASEYARMRALLDRQDIADCLARIARGADRHDRELYLSACHDDARVSVGGHVSPAAESFEGGREMHAQGTIATLHCLSTMNCEIDGDAAHAETYHIYCARTREDTNWAATGRHIDQFERRSGVWGLVFRHISVEWTDQMSPMELALPEAPDALRHRFSATRASDDVSYLRPLSA
jgi:SnoaL-like domain